MDFYSEENVEKIASAVLDKTIKKVTETLSGEFYDTIHSFLYEHYENADSRIKDNLIKAISERFVQDPMSYRYKDLRDKIFNEHKKELTELLTEEQLFLSVENIILDYKHRSHGFSWRWEDGIAKIIIKNIDMFDGNERIVSNFKRELENKTLEIARLKSIIFDNEEEYDE